MYQATPFSVQSRNPRYRITSPGEELWFSLRDSFALDKNGHFPAQVLAELADWVEPSGAMALYHGTVTITAAVFKLLKYARRIEVRDKLEGNALHALEGQLLFERAVVQYLVSHMGVAALDIASHRVIPPLVLRAHLRTRSDIGPETRTRVLNEAKSYHVSGNIHCYCCHSVLWSKILGQSTAGIPLDHLWPRSLGGVSKFENLLPICDVCNGAKQDRASWAVFGIVQDYALAARSNQSDLLLGLALHQRAANKLAIKNHLLLKDAFIELGPRTSIEQIDDQDGEHFFNKLAHDTSKLSSLW